MFVRKSGPQGLSDYLVTGATVFQSYFLSLAPYLPLESRRFWCYLMLHHMVLLMLGLLASLVEPNICSSPILTWQMQWNRTMSDCRCMDE